MTRAINNKIKLNKIVSVTDFGAKGDGVTDDTAAIQAAINFGDSVYLPAGKYLLSSTLTRTTGDFKLHGDGEASQLIRFGDYGDTLRITDPAGTSVLYGITLRDFAMSHEYGVAATSGAQISINACRNVWLDGILIKNGFRGFDILGSDQMHVNGLYIGFDRDNNGVLAGRRLVSILPTTNTGKGAHSGDVFFVNTNLRCGGTPYVEVGLEMTAGDGVFFSNGHIGNCTVANVRVNANNATKCTGLLLSDSWLDLGTGAGITFTGSVPTINGNHYVRGCKLLGGTTGANGVDIGGTATRIRITDNEISDWGNAGVFIRSGVTGEVTITDNVIRENSMITAGAANGITVPSTDALITIRGNIIRGSRHAQHISIAGAKTRAHLDNNFLIAPSDSGTLMNELSGTDVSQSDNYGFNPVGNIGAITTGASPWTYTNAKPYPIEIFIYGGTVSAIAKNGAAMTGLSGGSFVLAPKETLTVTYSAAPNARAFGL